MSAFLVGRNHISFLIYAALEYSRGGSFTYGHSAAGHKTLTIDNASSTGNMLLLENYKSLECRYEERADEREVFGEYLEHVYDLDAVQVLKAVGCYEYQACEHDDWEASEAHAFCEALRHVAISHLPGYDAAEWGAPKPKENTVSLMSLIRAHQRKEGR